MGFQVDELDQVIRSIVVSDWSHPVPCSQDTKFSEQRHDNAGDEYQCWSYKLRLIHHFSNGRVTSPWVRDLSISIARRLTLPDCCLVLTGRAFVRSRSRRANLAPLKQRSPAATPHRPSPSPPAPLAAVRPQAAC